MNHIDYVKQKNQNQELFAEASTQLDIEATIMNKKLINVYGKLKKLSNQQHIINDIEIVPTTDAIDNKRNFLYSQDNNITRQDSLSSNDSSKGSLTYQSQEKYQTGETINFNNPKYPQDVKQRNQVRKKCLKMQEILTEEDLQIILNKIMQNSVRDQKKNKILLKKMRLPTKNLWEDNIIQATPQVKTLIVPRSQKILRNKIISIISEETLVEVQKILQEVGSWNFNTILLEKITNKNPIVILVNFIFKKRSYYEDLKIKQSTFQNILQKINDSYLKENSYHNATHAADVTNSVLCMVEKCLFKFEEFQELEIFTLIFAAMVHDIGHKGVNNAFLIGVQDQLALIYNDQSVLENMHISKTFEILKEHKFFEFMNDNQFRQFRKIIIRLVLDTDLQKHFVIMKNFEKNVVADENFQDEEKRTYILSMCLKSADVGHGTKNVDLHKI